MQVHPHFLFNTLHAVAGLAIEDPPTARRMVIALGDLLRNTLKDSGGQMRTALALLPIHWRRFRRPDPSP
jgi:LytS/YehU family sensor histidine kinase